MSNIIQRVNAMGREIERKFLVNGDGFRNGSNHSRIVQGYLSVDPERTVRVRTCDGKAYLTVKGKTRGIARMEYEYEIPANDAREMQEGMCVGSIIEKVRYNVEYQGFTWEVDVFGGDNQGLIVAEIELEEETSVFPAPPWLGVEVSADPRFFNAQLTRNPYKNWRTQS